MWKEKNNYEHFLLACRKGSYNILPRKSIGALIGGGHLKRWKCCLLRSWLKSLAYLSRRLIGELIGYQWSGVRRRLSLTISNSFFSETAGPIKAKFYVEPPWVGGGGGGGDILCAASRSHDQDGRHAHIWVKTLQKSSSPEPAGWFSRNLVCGIGDSSPS